MADILLAFDEADNTMGSFNQACLETFEEYFESYSHKITYVRSDRLSDLTISLLTENGKPLIFAAYSHGSEAGQLNGSVNGVYVSTDVNIDRFRNSFFYTVSCFSGTVLGTRLIEDGCLSFIGYKSLFHYWDGYKSFPECANFGFFLFIEDHSTKTIYSKMVEKYNEQIDTMYQDNYLVASLLLKNRDALIHLGEDITINKLTSNPIFQ